MTDAARDFGPACPNCGRRIPFLKFLWGRGRPFQCLNCGCLVVVPKVATVPVTGAFIILLAFIRNTAFLRDNYWLTMGLFGIAMAIEYWLFTPVRRAPASDRGANS